MIPVDQILAPEASIAAIHHARRCGTGVEPSACTLCGAIHFQLLAATLYSQARDSRDPAQRLLGQGMAALVSEQARATYAGK